MSPHPSSVVGFSLPYLAFFFFFYSCCGDQCSLFCLSQSLLFLLHIQTSCNRSPSAAHTVPGGQLSEQQQVLHLIWSSNWGCYFSGFFTVLWPCSSRSFQISCLFPGSYAFLITSLNPASESSACYCTSSHQVALLMEKKELEFWLCMHKGIWLYMVTSLPCSFVMLEFCRRTIQ